MAQTVELPNGDSIEFPDGMSADEMSSAIASSFPDFAPKKSLLDRAKGAITSALSGSDSGDQKLSAFDLGGQEDAAPTPADTISMPGSVIDGQSKRIGAGGNLAQERGSPVRPEIYEQIKNQYDAATPEARSAMETKPGFAGSVSSAIGKMYAEQDAQAQDIPSAQQISGRREDRVARHIARDGASRVTAEAAATGEFQAGGLDAPLAGMSISDLDFEAKNAQGAKRVWQDFESGVVGSTGATLAYAGRKSGIDSLAEIGDSMDRWASGKMPGNPSFTDNLVAGIGSSGSFLIPGLGVARGAEALAVVSMAAGRLALAGRVAAAGAGNFTMSALEAAAEADGVYKDLIRSGQTADFAMARADGAFWKNMALLGVTNKLTFFNELKEAKTAIGRFKQQAPIAAVSEGGQEIAQQMISNDATDKPLMEGTGEAGLIGAIVGGGMGGAHSAMQATSPHQEAMDRAEQARIQALNAWQQNPLAMPRQATPADITAAPDLPSAAKAYEQAFSAPTGSEALTDDSIIRHAISSSTPTIEEIEGAAGVAPLPQWTARQATAIQAPEIQSTPLEIPKAIAGPVVIDPAAIPAPVAAQAETITPAVQPEEGAPNGLQTSQEAQAAEEVEAPVTAIDVAAHEAATSPHNALQEPTESQREAGNYKKGHVSISGLNISIENPAGSVRSGTSTSGKQWRTEMRDHYGYIKGTIGKDKDHLDAFIVGQHPERSNTVYIVDQIDPDTGRFDEHKIILGMQPNQSAIAKARYLNNYEKGWQGAGAVTEIPLDDFKQWLATGNTTKPFAFNESAQEAQKPAQSITRGKGGKLELVGFSQEEVAEAGKKLGVEIRTSDSGNILVTGKDGSAVSIKTQNKLKIALLGKDVSNKPKKAAGMTGNLTNDLKVLGYGGLRAEVARGGDGEGRNSRDLSELAEYLQQAGYMLPTTETGKASDAVIELIRQDLASGGGTVNEARLSAQMQKEEDAKKRSALLALADEYGVETHKGIISRKQEDIEVEVEKAIEHELGVAGATAGDMHKTAVAAGIPEADISTIEDSIADEFYGNPAKDAYVKMWRKIAIAIEDKINEHERSREEDANAGLAEVETGSAGEERPALELEQQSEADIRAEEARLEAAKEAEEAEAKAAEEKARKEKAAKEKDDIKRRLEEQPFVFGVGAKEAKTVQNDIFNTPATFQQAPIEKPDKNLDNPRRDTAPEKTPPPGGVSVSASLNPDQRQALYAALKGLTVTMEVMVQDEGTTAQLELDAETTMRDADDRVLSLEQLLDCVRG